MKILLVIDNLGSGGAQNQMTLLAQDLKNQGHEVHIFTYFPQDFFKERIEESNIHHFYVPKKDKIGWNVFTTLASILKKEHSKRTFLML